MRPPKVRTTVQIAANFGPASQLPKNSVVTHVQVNGGRDFEQGEIYLQLSLATLQELADLLEHDRLSPDDKATYNQAYSAGKEQYDQAVELRDQLQTRKTFFRKFIVKLFVRKSDAERFLQVTYRAYTGIRRTSDDLVRRLLPENVDTLVFGNPEASAQGQASVCEESPRDVVESSLSVADLPPNETIRGLNVDIHNEQEEQEVFAALGRIARAREADEEEAVDDDDDDGATIRPSSSQSRAPSPSPCTINVFYQFNQSVVSFDSETHGTTLNAGVNEGVGSAHS